MDPLALDCLVCSMTWAVIATVAAVELLRRGRAAKSDSLAPLRWARRRGRGHPRIDRLSRRQLDALRRFVDERDECFDDEKAQWLYAMVACAELVYAQTGKDADRENLIRKRVELREWLLFLGRSPDS